MTKPIIPFSTQESVSYADKWTAQLQADLPEARIVPISTLSDTECVDITCAIVANPNLQELARLKNLKWIQSVWAGVEGLTKTLPMDGPKIVRLIDPTLSATMAEAVLAWSLYLNRNMPHYGAAQRKGLWSPTTSRLAPETHICILGLGALGQTAAAALLKNGFNVQGWSRTAKAIEGIQTFAGDEGWRDAVKGAHIVVCLLPLTPQTKGALNAAFFAAMDEGSNFINFGRGGTVDDEALLATLTSGHLAHAVLDVFNVEPLPADHAYWQHERVTILPHISGPTHRPTASITATNNVRQYLLDGTIPKSVDREIGY